MKSRTFLKEITRTLEQLTIYYSAVRVQTECAELPEPEIDFSEQS